MTAIMPGKHASKLVILLVIDTIQAFDVWSYWREKSGEKARVWKKEEKGTPHELLIKKKIAAKIYMFFFTSFFFVQKILRKKQIT